MYTLNEARSNDMTKANELQILVIDDDWGILDSFDAMLGDDYNLVLANDGIEALNLLNTRSPRLLFLDIKMPGINGMDVLQKIRKRGHAITIVVVTALPQQHYQQMAEKHGVYRYLSKPLDVDEIENIARQVIH